jgi:molybdopterin/thiamine biosynthesis adenylyltransferase
MEAINPDVTVVTYKAWISKANISGIISAYDFIVDATDNFAAKFLINDACVLAGKPYSHGGILQFDGQTITVRPRESACYRCIFPEPPPQADMLPCSRAGVFGVLPGVIGSIQATEVLKFLLGTGDLLTDRLLTYSALRMKFREVPLKRSAACPVCGENPTIIVVRDEQEALSVYGLKNSI